VNKVASVEDVTSPKELKVADSNDRAPAAQSSTLEDDDDVPVDGPSEDRAAGENSTFQDLIAEFLI
jgi:hypothetical protein